MFNQFISRKLSTTQNTENHDKDIMVFLRKELAVFRTVLTFETAKEVPVPWHTVEFAAMMIMSSTVTTITMNECYLHNENSCRNSCFTCKLANFIT